MPRVVTGQSSGRVTVPDLLSNGAQPPSETGLGSEKLTRRGGRGVRGQKTQCQALSPPGRDQDCGWTAGGGGATPGEGRPEVGEALGESSANRASVSPSVRQGVPPAGESAGEVGEGSKQSTRHPSPAAPGLTATRPAWDYRRQRPEEWGTQGCPQGWRDRWVGRVAEVRAEVSDEHLHVEGSR